MTRLALQTQKDILELDPLDFGERDTVAVLKLKQAAAADILRTATRVDETIMRRQEISVLPKLRALIEAAKQKRLISGPGEAEQP